MNFKGLPFVWLWSRQPQVRRLHLKVNAPKLKFVNALFFTSGEASRSVRDAFLALSLSLLSQVPDL